MARSSHSTDRKGKRQVTLQWITGKYAVSYEVICTGCTNCPAYPVYWTNMKLILRIAGFLDFVLRRRQNQSRLVQWLRLDLLNGPNGICVSTPASQREDGNPSGFRNVVLLSVLYNTRQWTKSKTPIIPSVIHGPQNSSECLTLILKNRRGWRVNVSVLTVARTSSEYMGAQRWGSIW